jgi:hypothetical protein
VGSVPQRFGYFLRAAERSFSAPARLALEAQTYAPSGKSSDQKFGERRRLPLAVSQRQI